MLRFLILMLLTLGTFVPQAFAANVQVRAGRHDGFSRVVFDWGKPVTYSIKPSAPGTVIMHFDESGSINTAAMAIENITSASVVSSSPLEVTIAVKAGRVRDFQTGNKIILDVYDPPGAKKSPPPAPPKVEAQAKPLEKTPEKPAAQTASAEPKAELKTEQPKTEPPKQALAEAPPATKADVKPVAAAPLTTAPPSAPTPQIINDKGETITPPSQDALKTQQEAQANAPIRSNLITISSIDTTGLAVFKRGGKIWIVNDKDDILLSPQISGPDAKSLGPLETMNIEGGKAFMLPAMEGRIKGQGGGLLWRIVVPATPPKTPPVRPERHKADENTAKKPGQKTEKPETDPDGVRGGKLVWSFESARRVFDVPDPVTGRKMKVVTVAASKDYAGSPLEFVDFETLDSPVGLIIVPKVDDLEVTVTRDGTVEVTRPGGLAFTDEKDFAMAEAGKKQQINPGSQANAKRIFDFKNWQMGGVDALDQNRNIILTQVGGSKDNGKVEGILTLAKMYLSNGLWAEAKGFLDMAEDNLPELNQNPAFTALHGAAQALGHESEDAFDQLSSKDLDEYPEIGYWRAFALAELGDWQQADSVFPDELYILSEYPAAVRTKLSLVLAEVALRAGDTAKGEEILGFVDEDSENLKPSQLAAMDYLRGEAARQRNKIDDTKKFWKPLTTGRDPLYRAKAGLALTRLLVDKKELKGDKAIDNLERLRYAWRGDELEAQIAYWLGKSYFEAQEYVKGLVIMHEAAGYAADTDIGRKITTEMTDVFKKLFLGPDLDKVSALDAAALHEQFAGLIPEGPDNDKITERLAERLVKADLLDKASDLLRSLGDHLDASEGYRVMVRLAAINLIDDQPGKAIASLDQAALIYPKLPEELKSPQRELEIPLLRARALSEQDRPDQALALLKTLPRNPDVNKLRADIAWHAAYWDDAAEALQDVILDRDISLTRPLDASNTALILQRAVALNLASDRVGLANMREKFSDPMAQTDKGHIFEVVTRPRQSTALADRQTLMSVVSEVDLFKDFLNSYKTEPAPPAAPAAAAPATPPAPEKTAETAPAAVPPAAGSAETPPPATPPAQ